MQSLRLVPIALARRFVPAPLRIVPVAPGRTLGVFYLARYGPGSTLEYDELILAPALVTSGGRVGFRITGIWVNDARSMGGGHAIWSLPKQMARFDWASAGHCRIRDDAGPLCELQPAGERGAAAASSLSDAGLPLPLLLPVLSGPAQQPRFFCGRGSARVSLGRGELWAPDGSDLERLGFTGLRRVLRGTDLRLTVPAPGD